jgi:DNA-directed RNA polymerase specialized sigma24 family protein
MPSHGSITRWLGKLKAGDPAAAQQLWDRYFQRLVGLARLKLRAVPRQNRDEEGVAASAFHSFCRGAGKGQFPQLLDSDNLWRLLAAITARKAAHLVRDETRLKRGGAAGRVSPAEEAAVLEQLLSREPTAEMAAQMADQCRHLLRRLGAKELEAVAVARMEGYSVEEIAALLGLSKWSIKRKLQLIRDIWENEDQT